jgi:hypothetical protein
VYSFLVYANVNDTDTAVLLDKACRITNTLMPSLGAEIEDSQRIIPEINGGWFCLFPAEVKRPLISEFSDDRVAILVFGHVFQSLSKTGAECVVDAWQRGKIDAVRELDGCFSAVIIDLKERTIHIASDIVGLRTLRYYHDRQHLLISPHDIPIIATGLCPVEFNLDSACSIVSCEWSLQGRPLLEKINACDPNECITWHDGTLSRVRKQLLISQDRIKSGDHISCARQIDLMIEKMREKTRTFCSNSPGVRIDVTAGLDTRAILGILLSVVDGSHVKARTSGAVDSSDVRMAKKLAKHYKFSHEYHVPKAEGVDSFLAYSKLLAFAMNGDTNSKRAVHPLPRLETAPPPLFDGSGGEIYRGYYYPKPSARPGLAQLTTDDIISLLEKKFPKLQTLPWPCPDFAENVRSRLVEIVGSFSQMSPHPSDMLDLFYLYERYGRWGSMTARSTWDVNRYSVFTDPGIVKLAYMLGPPISNDCLLHKTIVKRFIPRAYYRLVNRRRLLSLMGYSKPKHFAQELLRRTCGRIEQCWSLPASAEQLKTHEQIRAEIFAGPLAGTLTDMLLSTDGIATEILQKSGLQKMLEEHISGRKNHLQMLGFLVTIEQWRELVQKAKTLAQQG